MVSRLWPNTALVRSRWRNPRDNQVAGGICPTRLRQMPRSEHKTFLHDWVSGESEEAVKTDVRAEPENKNSRFVIFIGAGSSVGRREALVRDADRCERLWIARSKVLLAWRASRVAVRCSLREAASAGGHLLYFYPVPSTTLRLVQQRVCGLNEVSEIVRPAG